MTRKRRMVHYCQCRNCGHAQRVKRLDWHLLTAIDHLMQAEKKNWK